MRVPTFLDYFVTLDPSIRESEDSKLQSSIHLYDHRRLCYFTSVSHHDFISITLNFAFTHYVRPCNYFGGLHNSKYCLRRFPLLRSQIKVLETRMG